LSLQKFIDMINANLKNFFKFYKVFFLLKIILYADGAEQKEKTKTRSPQVTPGVPIGKLFEYMNLYIKST
jgi:hypothetical protein